MKKITLILILNLLMYTAFAQVQRKSSPSKNNNNTSDTLIGQNGLNEQGKDNSRREMMKKLDLTKEQKIKMRDMRQANKAKREDIDNDATLTADQKKDKIRALRKEAAVTMQSILTKEQWKKMQEMRKENKEESMDPVQ